MVERSLIIDRFLSANGWERSQLASLVGDASFRTYGRLVDNGRRAILMDAPPPMENVRPFVRISRHLSELGLSAPQVLAASEDEGLLLLEDFGDETFSQLLMNGADERSIYSLAIDVLAYIHKIPCTIAVPFDLARYDERKFIDESLIFVDWYLPRVTGLEIDSKVRRSYMDAWSQVLAFVIDEPPVLVLRDFHVDNLMRLKERVGIAACGLLDFQDALAGPRAYDVMSLLEDARRDISAEIKSEMLNRYLSAVQIADSSAFRTAFTILAAQRHVKVIGIFTRLHVRDGKSTYLVHIPRVWRLLKTALVAPILEPVSNWFKLHVPDHQVVPSEDMGAA